MLNVLGVESVVGKAGCRSVNIHGILSYSQDYDGGDRSCAQNGTRGVEDSLAGEKQHS